MFCFSNFNYWCPLNIKRQPAIERLTDYYPFGMEMGGRSYKSNDYRFGYTGHEKESDIAEGVYTTQYRLLDTRLGRWLSVDPLFAKYPGMSSYNYCAGNPVMFCDNNGDTLVIEYIDLIGNTQRFRYMGPTTKVDNDNDFVKTVVATLNYLYDYEDSKNNINAIINSKVNVPIKQISETDALNNESPAHTLLSAEPIKDGDNVVKMDGIVQYKYNTLEVGWCPSLGALLRDDVDENKIVGFHSPSIILDHELTHVKHILENTLKYVRNVNATGVPFYDNMEDKRTIKDHESASAEYFGESTRTNHWFNSLIHYEGTPSVSNDIYEDFSGPSMDRGSGTSNQTEIQLNIKE